MIMKYLNTDPLPSNS